MRKLELFSYFKNHMILQRNTEINVWGWGEKGSTVTVIFNDIEYNTVVGDDESFILKVATGEAGGPYVMKVSDNTTDYIIDDIYLGDVYLISGQSNMQLPMERTIDLTGDKLESLRNPMIREYRVSEKFAFGYQEKQFSDVDWLIADNENDLLNMSATGFNFATFINRSENIPIGLINNSIGGTPVEAHLPEEILNEFKIYDEEIEKNKDTDYVQSVIRKDLADMNEWFSKLESKDPGMKDGEALFAAVDFDDSSWDEINAPGMFFGTEYENWHGSMWFRREFYIPDDYNIQGVLLRLGTLVDADKVYINGVMVGSTDYCYPPRRYMVPDGILNHGRNVLAIRLVINRGVGGFTWDKKWCLQGKEYIYEGGYIGQANNPADADPEKGRWEIDLSGTFKCIKGGCMEVLPLMTFFIYKPTALYNAMMHPLINASVVGALWYQGESNTGNPEQYDKLMEQLIACYRKWFGKDLPFYNVSLPQFGNPELEAPISDWAYIREKQRQVFLNVENTAMTVNIDIGESNDLHPQNKEAIGYRLALAALNMHYGHKDVAYTGPMIKRISCNEEAGFVDIVFTGQDEQIVLVNDNYEYFDIDGQKATGFEIIANDTLRVYYGRTDVKPDQIRYAWMNDPCKPPIYDKAGLPAAAFSEKIR